MVFKVCPDYMSEGLMRNRFTEKGESWVYVDKEFIDCLGLTEDTRQLLALCQQIFDQTDSWAEGADYTMPHFIRRDQYETLCNVVAERIQKETDVLTFAEFYWS